MILSGTNVKLVKIGGKLYHGLLSNDSPLWTRLL